MTYALGRLLVHARGPIKVIEDAQEELKVYEALREASEVMFNSDAPQVDRAHAYDRVRVALARLRELEPTGFYDNPDAPGNDR